MIVLDKLKLKFKNIQMFLTPNDLPDFSEVKKGDDYALSVAYKEFWGIGFYQCSQRLKNTGIDIENITQEAVCEVLAKINELNSWDHAKAKITLVARNMAIDAIRKSTAGKRGDGKYPMPLESILDEPPSSSNSQPDKALMNKEIGNTFRDCLKILPVRQQEVITLRLTTNLKHFEISDKLSIPQGSVGVIIQRVLDALKECFKQKGVKL